MSLAAVSPGSAMAAGVGEPQPHLILVAASHEKMLWLQAPWIKSPVSPWTSRKPKQLREDVPRAEHFTWWSEPLRCLFDCLCIILMQNSPSSEPSSPTGTLASSFYPARASCSLLEGDRSDCSCGHCPGQGFLLPASSSATWGWGGQPGSLGVSLPHGGCVILDEN